MKRRIQGLIDTTRSAVDQVPDGVFLVRGIRHSIDGMRRSPFMFCRTSRGRED